MILFIILILLFLLLIFFDGGTNNKIINLSNITVHKYRGKLFNIDGVFLLFGKKRTDHSIF